jgi:arsenical pump membrane protein
MALISAISWCVLPLVAGLFVLVEMLAETGVIAQLSQLLARATLDSQLAAARTSRLAIALGSNAINNLLAGLVASATALQAHSPERVIDAMLIGVDLSITGSLATILWLLSIRREGEEVDFMQFLRIGSVVMPHALVLAMGARFLIGH